MHAAADRWSAIRFLAASKRAPRNGGPFTLHKCVTGPGAHDAGFSLDTGQLLWGASQAGNERSPCQFLCPLLQSWLWSIESSHIHRHMALRDCPLLWLQHSRRLQTRFDLSQLPLPRKGRSRSSFSSGRRVRDIAKLRVDLQRALST